MQLITIILIGLALSMDAFAVSVASGTALRKTKILYTFRMAAFFGGFQAVMPVIGWFAGIKFESYIESFDHWIAFILLALIGGKMIYEAIVMKENEEKAADPSKIAVLLMLAIATSIDALAVGITFACLGVSILVPVIIIGVITFSLPLLGVFIGSKLGDFFENKIEFAGGLILIGIGIKILIEHLLAR